MGVGLLFCAFLVFVLASLGAPVLVAVGLVLGFVVVLGIMEDGW